jgi:hypothetical protein
MEEHDAMTATRQVRFRVDVRVALDDGEDFRLSFDFTDDADEGVGVRCSRDLSGDDAQRLEKLATDFVGNIAAIIFKMQ